MDNTHPFDPDLEYGPGRRVVQTYFTPRPVRLMAVLECGHRRAITVPLEYARCPYCKRILQNQRITT